MNCLNYGVIGNCKSAALVSKNGAIEWACLPNFNSSSVFAKLLDYKKGGEFALLVDETYTCQQRYIPDTNILVTHYSNSESSFDVFDFMPRYHSPDGSYYNPPDIVRYIKNCQGQPVVRIKYQPKLHYAEHETLTHAYSEYIKSYTIEGVYESVYLYSSFNLSDILQSNPIQLTTNSFLLMSYNQKIMPVDVPYVNLMYEKTKVYWLNWSSKTVKYARFDEYINRSALVLKLLTFQETGAILAAITTSLPETVGEVRNWDYRYCWIRDASMILRALNSLGHYNAAKRFLNFIIRITPTKDEQIQIMYGINGERQLTEEQLTHLSGFENSKPVRIGNAAYKQKQHDIYGVLVDVIYQNFKLFETSVERCEELWTIVRSIIRSVQRNWRLPDKGIWEFRSEPRHFTFSKVLCWLALDRGAKIAGMLHKPGYAKEWKAESNEIKKDVHENAWNKDVGAFTQSYDSVFMDASNLLMETYGFIEASNPKYVATVKTTKKALLHNALMYRYKNEDDFGQPSSSFTICTFWMIQSLYKIGERQQAVELFEQLLQYSNHLGLFSEDIDFESKRLLGNFPQGYSHLALIETAILLGGEKTREKQILEILSQ